MINEVNLTKITYNMIDLIKNYIVYDSIMITYALKRPILMSLVVYVLFNSRSLVFV